MGTQLSSPKRGQRPQFWGSFLLWPIGWMHQDVTWYGGRPQPRRLCVRWGPSSPKRHSPPIFSPCLLWPNGCMYQDITWYGGRPQPRQHCVRWGPSCLSPKGAQPPNFWPMSVVAKRLGGLRCLLVCRQASAQATLCSMGTQLGSPRKKAQPLPNFWPMSIVAKGLDG